MLSHILHLGVGNFFRAHQAHYTHNAAGWDITGVSFRSATVRDGLAAQGYRYALVIKDAAGTEITPITCLRDILVAPEDPEPVLARIADPATQVITLTVTEKAYCLGPDGRLDLSDAAVHADLIGGAMTVVGALARGLARRTAPVTVLSCDNLPGNGAKLGAAVARFAEAAELHLTARVTFPSCMVDRITPATTDAIRAEADDPMAVPTEAFTEWVVEDDFAAARPDWPGVQWVTDVAPHEMRKLRMLNGAHSYLAYAGTLAGHVFVHEAVADPVLRHGAAALMAEAAETLPDAVRGQAADYARALLRRFDNPNLHHRLRQIAMDGSQKMPIRIAQTIVARHGPSPALQAAVTAWIDFVRAEVAAGRPLDDPQAAALVNACAAEAPDAALRAMIMPE
ncbi:mannitol dehydrogenase family protein [Tateyamaria sp. SN6-1]|uniref:mannitol dehydrogenase family protein n=1 Tax=Tateyamaria sp. SN6-1 TaxID=3092148 RepID=UPI0039F47FA0